jgi:hypothetical protein
VDEHAILEQVRIDLRDVLELDCNARLLLDEPDYLINQWIMRSEAMQTIIEDMESMLDEEVWKD